MLLGIRFKEEIALVNLVRKSLTFFGKWTFPSDASGYSIQETGVKRLKSLFLSPPFPCTVVDFPI
jgi:hypothetical protein